MSPIGKELHILIIEDNLGDVILVKEYLEEHFRVLSYVHAHNFMAAEKVLLKDSSFDVVLLDLMLPDSSGSLLVQRTIQLSGHIPVIMLTGSLNLKFCVEALQIGVSDYLFKDELNSNSLFKSIHFAIEKQKNLLKLKASERNYSDLFNLCPAAMFVYDETGSNFLDVNAAAIALYEYSREEFLKIQLQELLFETEWNHFKELIEKVDQKKNFSFANPVIFRSKSRRKIKAELTVKSIRFSNKKARLVVVDDITEQLLQFEAINTQNQLLQEISWQQSHELRSPASKIIGIVEILSKGLCTKEEEKLLITEIGSSALELDQVIKSMSKKTKQVQPKKSRR